MGITCDPAWLIPMQDSRVHIHWVFGLLGKINLHFMTLALAFFTVKFNSKASLSSSTLSFEASFGCKITHSYLYIVGLDETFCKTIKDYLGLIPLGIKYGLNSFTETLSLF